MVIEAPVINDNYQIKMQSFKNELINMNVIEAVTRSSAIPGKEVAKFLANRYEYAAEDEQRLCEMLKVDFDFIDTYELKLTAGRNFDKEMSTDSIALILNQAAVAQFGFASDEEAVNKRIILEGTPDKRNHIIGVVKNYHQQSLKKDHTPIILFMDPDYGWIPITYFSLKLNTNDLQKTIAQIQEHWNIFFPESSFDYFFLDEFFNRQYLADQQYGKTISTFTILAIAISCMGLFGLTIFSVSNRTKEIGIRKVLGASVYSIFALLNIELVKLILISSIIGIPMSFFIIQKWLDGYAFKINLSWWVFGIPVIFVMVIAVLSTSFLTIRGARTNPAQSLRNE
jgi:putative ABC transport system permease protein